MMTMWVMWRGVINVDDVSDGAVIIALTPLISYPVFSESAVLAVVAENQSNI